MTDTLRWFVHQRMQWIAETLRIFGFIRREHLMLKFGISTPQAAADLKRYSQMHPGALRYDATLKTYRAAEAKRSVIELAAATL